MNLDSLKFYSAFSVSSCVVVHQCMQPQVYAGPLNLVTSPCVYLFSFQSVSEWI